MDRGWSLISIAQGRQYAGNTGYADDVRQIYRYDSRVANHKQLSVGHLVVLRDDKWVLGAGRVSTILAVPTTKTVQQCPSCGSKRIRLRKHAEPKWMCSECHVGFASPASHQADVVGYEATYGASFVEAPAGIPMGMLREATPRPNDQLAIQELDLGALSSWLVPLFPAVRPLLEGTEPIPLLSPLQGDDQTPTTPGDGYAPSGQDDRQRVLRSILQRRGQRSFRQSLINRYGPRCMLTGCELIDLVEAAHISPYRGPQDNAAENGLLLRADIHTLFDLGLLTFHPDTLVVRISELAAASGYDSLVGKKLDCGPLGPSRAALATRWDVRFDP